MPVKAPPRDPTNSWQRQHMGETMMHRAARAPSGECFQQSTGVTKIWRDQAFRKRATDRRQDAQRSGPLALVAPEAGRRMAARSSNVRARCRWATASADRKAASATTSLEVPDRRNSSPRWRCISASNQRCPVRSISTCSSSSKEIAASGLPASPSISASNTEARGNSGWNPVRNCARLPASRRC